MKARLLALTGIALVSLWSIPTAAQGPDWLSPKFKFAQPIRLVAKIPVKETRQKPADTDGLPPRPGGGIIGVLEGALLPGTVLGSTTASNGDTLRCVVAGPNETAESVLTVTIESRIGMRGYRINGDTIEFRAGFESRPDIQYSGRLPKKCRGQFEQEAEADLERLIAGLVAPAGAFPIDRFFAAAEAGTPASLPVRLVFLREPTTVTLTFPRPRPFGE